MAYKNKLGLSGIPRIEALCPKGLGFFSGKTDEFIQIANTIEEWQLQRKSIVDYVQDEDHQAALLKDVALLKKQSEVDLIKERQRPSDEQSPHFIRRRETFIKNAETEIARLQGWKPVPKEEREISFREFNAKAICLLVNDGARKAVIGATIHIFEEGDFIITQELIETNQQRELAQAKITKANTGQPIKVSFDTVGISRLVLSEKKTGREESRVL